MSLSFIFSPSRYHHHHSFSSSLLPVAKVIEVCIGIGLLKKHTQLSFHNKELKYLVWNWQKSYLVKTLSGPFCVHKFKHKKDTQLSFHNKELKYLVWNWQKSYLLKTLSGPFCVHKFKLKKHTQLSFQNKELKSECDLKFIQNIISKDMNVLITV